MDECENCQDLGSVICDNCDGDGCWACGHTGAIPCDYCD
jgi:hypothetical protein